MGVEHFRLQGYLSSLSVSHSISHLRQRGDALQTLLEVAQRHSVRDVPALRSVSILSLPLLLPFCLLFFPTVSMLTFFLIP